MGDDTVDVRERIRRARAAGHDALARTRDPEALWTGAELARDGFLAWGDPADLRAWVACARAFAEVTEGRRTDAEHDWLLVQDALLVCVERLWGPPCR